MASRCHSTIHLMSGQKLIPRYMSRNPCLILPKGSLDYFTSTHNIDALGRVSHTATLEIKNGQFSIVHCELSNEIR